MLVDPAGCLAAYSCATRVLRRTNIFPFLSNHTVQELGLRTSNVIWRVLLSCAFSHFVCFEPKKGGVMSDCCGFIRPINSATLFNPCYVLKLRLVRGTPCGLPDDVDNGRPRRRCGIKHLGLHDSQACWTFVITSTANPINNSPTANLSESPPLPVSRVQTLSHPHTLLPLSPRFQFVLVGFATLKVRSSRITSSI